MKKLGIALILVQILLLGGCKDDSSAGSRDAGSTDTTQGDDGGTDSEDPPCDNPTIDQPDAGLDWQTCFVGQCWEGGQCAGDPSTLAWDPAQDSCAAGFRLPTKEEYMAVLGNCDPGIDADTVGYCTPCPDSAACNAMFPEVVGYDEMSLEVYHWTSTERNESNAWRVNFLTGYIKYDGKTRESTLRCLQTP